jgi:hypothetical protein
MCHTVTELDKTLISGAETKFGSRETYRVRLYIDSFVTVGFHGCLEYWVGGVCRVLEAVSKQSARFEISSTLRYQIEMSCKRQDGRHNTRHTFITD